MLSTTNIIPTSGFGASFPVTATSSVASSRQKLEPGYQAFDNNNFRQNAVHAHTEAYKGLSAQEIATDASCSEQEEIVKSFKRELQVARWISECLPSTSICTKTMLPLLIIALICPARAHMIDDPLIYGLDGSIQVLLVAYAIYRYFIIDGRSTNMKLHLLIVFFSFISTAVAAPVEQAEFSWKTLAYNFVWFLFLVVDICTPVAVILWFWHRDHDRSIYPTGAPAKHWALCATSLSLWLLLPLCGLFVWFLVHAMFYTLAIPFSFIYFGLQSWWEWCAPTGTLLYAVQDYTVTGAPARVPTRRGADDPAFADVRSQQRSIRKAIDTSLVHVNIKYENITVMLCAELIELCVMQYIRSNPTKSEVNTFMMAQTQFNLTDAEWIDHQIYVPGMVCWRVRVKKEEMMKFEQLTEELTDYDELSVRDKQRRYRLFLKAFLGARGSLTLAKIIAGYIVLGIGIFLMFRIVSATYMVVDHVLPAGLADHNHTMYVKDMRYTEQMAIRTEPALKPVKPDFEWVREPTNESGKRTRLVSILGKNDMPLQLGYHYDRRDPDNFTRAIEQRVAVTNVVDPLNFHNLGDGNVHYHPDFALMHQEADALKEILKTKCDRPYVFPDRDEIVAWLDSRHYPQVRTKQILHAYDEAKSLMPADLLKQRSGRVEAFIKEEYYPEFKNPRAILARGDLAKALLGPAFDQLNHVFFELPETVKKLPAAKRPDYIMNRCSGPFFYVTDHTAFECSATAEIQRNLEMRVYRDIMGQDLHKYLDILLRDQLVTVGNGSAFVPVARFSGEMNTSLGNSITNYVFIKMIMKHFNVTGNFFIEGDDGLICLQQPLNIPAVERYATENGFKLKIARVVSPGTAGFLSTYWDDDNVPYKYPLGKYLAGSAWTIPQCRIEPMPLLIARLSSMIEENPKNNLIIALHSAFCKKYSHDGDKLYIYKPDDNYFREKLDLQGIKYQRQKGQLVYEMPRYSLDPRGRQFLLEKYGLNFEHYEELMAKIRSNPDSAYSDIVDLFSLYQSNCTYIDYQLCW